MRCPIETPEGSELLLAYSAHKLDAATASSLEDHIRACHRCQEFTGAQRQVWEALDGWSPQPVSAEFDRRLYRRIEQETGWWARFVGPLRPMLAPRGLPAAVAACLVIAAGVLLERPGAAPTVPTTSAAQFESAGPEPADPALQEMEIMREFSQLVRQAPVEPKM